MNGSETGRDPVAGGSLFTDLYELSMAQAYLGEGLTGPAEFEIHFRDPGRQRGYVIAAGLESVLRALEQFALTSAELEYLSSLDQFGQPFIDWLAEARFEGEVHAMPEGTAAFANEPLLRVRAELPLAQILETRVLNAIHYESIVATKATRIVKAAAGRGVVDFGARRAHGVDAAVAAARSSWIGGCGGTSNMVAGHRLGLPVVGTMAHSYIQAHDSELEAFRRFVTQYPATTLLVDTYDTLEGVRNVIRLAAELGDDFAVQAIRIDSGDLDRASREARALLDEAGLTDVGIIVSGGLEERTIGELVRAGAPVTGFGVGTELVVSADQPSLDFAYKLVARDGVPCMKASSGKVSLPGPKQVFREWDQASMLADTIAVAGEALAGEPLLQPVMEAGRRLDDPPSLDAIRERALAQRDALPEALHGIEVDPEHSFPVRISELLEGERERLLAQHRGAST